MRKEHDFLGELNVPDEVYYGVQTIRAVENFKITGQRVDTDFIIAMAQVKKAAVMANMSTGRLEKSIGEPLQQAAEEIIGGRFLDQFPVDPIQGGAGTSFNMNMNEVLCNRALEITGQAKGRYDIISPNNHGNMAQSTNDTFPTAIKVCRRGRSYWQPWITWPRSWRINPRSTRISSRWPVHTCRMRCRLPWGRRWVPMLPPCAGA